MTRETTNKWWCSSAESGLLFAFLLCNVGCRHWPSACTNLCECFFYCRCRPLLAMSARWTSDLLILRRYRLILQCLGNSPTFYRREPQVIGHLNYTMVSRVQSIFITRGQLITQNTEYLHIRGIIKVYYVLKARYNNQSRFFTLKFEFFFPWARAPSVKFLFIAERWKQGAMITFVCLFIPNSTLKFS